jgi:glucarate dehydratase
MGHVRRETGLRLSTNSCVTSFSHIPAAVKNQPVDVVLCDHHFWGGITACQALGHLAKVMKWELSQHSNNHAGISMAAMIHVAAVTPELTSASDTHYPWLIEGADIIQGDNFTFTNGRLPIPNGPGLGVILDEDKLARAQETYVKCKMRERDDAATMRKLVPGWERTLF